MKRGGHPYIYVVGATGTAVIDPTDWQLLVIASGIVPGPTGFLVDNHYLDQFHRLWSVSSATQPVMPWEASVPGGVCPGRRLRLERKKLQKREHDRIGTECREYGRPHARR
jgi:hypothetical protein